MYPEPTASSSAGPRPGPPLHALVRHIQVTVDSTLDYTATASPASPASCANCNCSWVGPGNDEQSLKTEPTQLLFGRDRCS